MPRAYDRYPTARGMGGDSLYSPTRGGLPWQNPLEAITGTAADTVTAIGETIRQWLALDQFDAAFAEFGAAILGLNWTSPAAVRGAIAAGGKLVADLGAWILQVFQNITRLDLTGQTGFVHDLIDLLALEALYTAWDTFITGWSNLNWANPIAAIHPAWMLVVDLVWDVAAWAGQALENLIGVSLPGFFALGELRAHWTEFFTRWGTINWAHPLTAIHTAWMAVVDLVWNLADWAQTVLQNLTGIDLPSFFDTDALKGVWDTFTSEWAAISWTSLTAIWSALKAVGNLLRGLVHWAIGVFRNLTGIDLEAIAASFALDALVGAITLWANTIAGINWSNPVAGLMTAIGATITLAQDLGNWLLTVIESWLGWSTSVVHGMFSSVNSFVLAVIEFFWGAEGVAGWTKALDVLGGVGATIVGAITGGFAEVSRLAALIGDFADLGGLVDWLQDRVNDVWELFSGGVAFTAKSIGDVVDAILAWITRVPLIGPLVAYLTRNVPGTFTPDLAGLAQWAERLLHSGSKLPAQNLFGQIPEAILGIIPVAHINEATPNLLSQGGFDVESSVASADGWSWEATNDPSVIAGGCVRVDCNGTPQNLYSNQTVAVVAGDRLNLNCRIITSAYAGSGSSIRLALIPFIGAAAQSAVVFASRGASNGTWVTMAGSGSTAPWTVPENVTSVRVRLSVTAPAGSVAKFDNVNLNKTGTLKQNLVDSLISAWQGLWDGLVGDGFGAAKSWADMVLAGTTVRQVAGAGVTNAATADGKAVAAQTANTNTNKAIYNAFYGSGAAGTSAEVSTTIAAIKQKIDGGWTIQTITANGTWTRPWGSADAPKEFWVIAVGSGSGGGKGQWAYPGNAPGGVGGSGGRWYAKQLDAATVDSSVWCTIGAGGAGKTSGSVDSPANQSNSSFGSYVNTADIQTASIAGMVGFYAATDSRPGDGGSGGLGQPSGTGVASTAGGAGESTPLASGGPGGSAVQAASWYGVSGSAGANATLTGQYRAGGGGGGGGGAGSLQSAGAGGPGGFPGGGGGGGGGAYGMGGPQGGKGGNGANGIVILLWK